MSDYFKGLCDAKEDAKASAPEARALAIAGWINKENEVREDGTSGIDATGFAAALKKLKKGKNSPDSRWTDSKNPAKPSLGAKNNALPKF